MLNFNFNLDSQVPKSGWMVHNLRQLVKELVTDSVAESLVIKVSPQLRREFNLFWVDFINVTIGRVLFSDPIAFVDVIFRQTYLNLMLLCFTWFLAVFRQSVLKKITEIRMKVIFCVIWHKLTKWNGTTYNKNTNNILNLMTEGRKGKAGLERSNFERKV